ncbi:acetyl-CoA C-acyltransferase [Paractinoplanes brasiliensis]|uniref:Acetyl-CoA acyltransferase n=1 Tax=Paractinoplanes brasiliensis TaxID=52695 RepID=A0A4R6JSN6_9ACTN|nr:acetyl-CoA C-acyltransferase [Actinoplanes brasiliensis]TDO39624.1 acetyl-CoA acyltransferase [Actinoplanes brasiliensis]GID29037.1 acetyl-CoA acyltransferase [Actinoplanes brasiliensis]
MRDAVIVGAVRTPIGRRGGGLAAVHPVDLSAHVLRALSERTGFDPADVDDVMWGCVSQVAEQSWNIGRNAVLAAGWPEAVPGTTIDRQCGSSQQALHFAAATVISGQADLVVAGGVESMTRVPMGSSGQGADPYGETLRTRFGVDSFDQGIGAEMMAERWGFSRAQLEEYALSSHAAAARAQDAGEFDAEIEPLAGVKQDEGIRRDTTLEKLAGLRTPFREDGRITAGTASQISDGASALAVTTSEWAAEHGLRPLARVHAAVIAADDPVIVLTAPIPATAKVLARAGLKIDDLGVYEVNEAFAPVPLAWLAETGADRARMNPRGGAIALGHPLGASGARIMTTMLHHMRQSGIRYGLQTMCEGAGMANATIVEAL